MGLRDRFFSPQTAKAILSWRILVGAAVSVVLALVDVPLWLAVVAGIVVYGVAVAAAMPRARQRPAIDPFTVGEPWRQLMQSARASERKLAATIAGVDHGPLRNQLDDILSQLRHGLDEAWAVARRGDDIDDTVRRLDPVSMRSKLEVLEHAAASDASPANRAAVDSVNEQLRVADRLKAQSDEAATTLRAAQVQLDSLVARASEVAVGSADTGTYAHEVGELVIRLEALRQAVNETPA